MDIDKAAEMARDRDVDDSAEGRGAWAGRDETPLYDRFYDSKEFQLFGDWIGDALTDHDENHMKVLQSVMACIRLTEIHIAAQGQRGDVVRQADTMAKREEYIRRLGKEVYEMVDQYMRKVSESF